MTAHRAASAIETPSPEDEERDRLLYELPTNVVVAAGAGTGKTHRLSGLYLHLVAGLTEVPREDGTRGVVLPDAIVATTFTREAASEMRSRIEARLRLLVRDGVERLATSSTDAAPWSAEILRTCARRGVPVPERSVWARALDALPRGTITTFHSWAGELVRAHPLEAGVPPGFALLEPEESDALLERAVTDAASAWIDDERPEAGLPRSAAIRRLLSSGVAMLAPAVRNALARASEEGVDPHALALADDEDDLVRARARRRALVEALERVVAARSGSGRAARDAELHGALHAARAALDALERGDARAEVVESFAAAVKTIRGTRPSSAWADARARLDEALGTRGASVEERATLVAEEPERTADARALERVARAFLADVAARVAAEKRRARALDFGDVLRRARDLLRDHPDIQAEVAGAVRALLVDEFQDTNALQRDLVYLARQDVRAIARRAPGELPHPSTLAPTGLFLVGDRKQSIYSFRGADVGVFQRMAIDLAGADAGVLLGLERATGEGFGRGRVVSLDRNRRSVDEILDFVNALAEVDMRGHDDLAAVERVVFQPELEALKPVRTSGRAPDAPRARVIVPEIELPEAVTSGALEASGDLLAALAVAAELRAILRDPGPLGRSSLRARDVAVLIRTYAALPALELALSVQGLEYAVASGRGLFATAEAGDLEALVRVALDRCDRNALLAVLRGPLVALPDAALLALAGGAGLSLDASPHARQALEASSRERLDRFVEVLDELERHAASLSPGEALGRALEQLRYEETLALLPGGEARIRDARKLVELADRFPGGLAPFARWLAGGRAGEYDEARGALFDEEHDAIRILTIHASKGLEFPVVVAMQLDHVGPASTPGPLLVGRGPRGLSLATRVERNGRRDLGAGGRALADRARAADRAERQRLTYVALTRARDVLYAVTTPKLRGRKVDDASAAASVERLLSARPDLVTRKTLRASLEAAQIEAPPTDTLDAPAPPAAPPAEPPAPVAPRGSTVVTTALADFALCPRRFRLLHVLAIPEHAPRARPFTIPDPTPAPEPEPEPEPEPDLDPETPDADDVTTLPVAPAPGDPRAQGVLAHLALERAPFPAVAGDRAAPYAEAFLREQGYDPDDPASTRIAARIVRFLRSSYARSLAADVTVARERAFVVELPSGVALRGTIDLVVVRRLADRLRVEVVDYKSGQGSAESVARYALQLRAYAAACASGRVVPLPAGVGVEVVAGLAFLGSGEGSPIWLDDGADLSGRANADALDALAGRLLAARARGEWPGIAAPACEAARCGFVPLCHPRGRST